MRSRKNLAAAILGLVIIGTAFAAAAQTQQSESSVQSAVREARDGIQRANPSASTPTSTGSSTPTPPRPEIRSDPSACPQKDRQNCRK
jgi:type II secretory pathway pseudopilin PulG